MENKFIQLDPVFLNNKKLDVRVIRSKNKNGYAFIKDSSIIISIPSRLSGAKSSQMVGELYKKMARYVVHHQNRFIEPKIYFSDGNTTSPMGIRLKISTKVLDIKYPEYSLDTGSIIILIPKSVDVSEHSKIVDKLTIKAISNSMYAFVAGRLNVINNKSFNSKIKRVRIKLNKNTWGSTSPDNVITINMKLLYAPLDILDYVIVHELAHTKVRDHSKRFWKVVEETLPNYKEKRAWLREHGPLITV